MYGIDFKFKNGANESILLKEIPGDNIEALTKRISNLTSNGHVCYFTDKFNVDHIINTVEVQYISIEKYKHCNS